jgi:hypothetical protein
MITKNFVVLAVPITVYFGRFFKVTFTFVIKPVTME